MGLTSAIGIQRVRSKGRRADQTAKGPDPCSLCSWPIAARYLLHDCVRMRSKINCIMRRAYSAPCFRTVSSPPQNGFVPKKGSRRSPAACVPIPRDKYVERCKQRAFDYLDRGDLKSAVFFIRQQHGCPIRLRVAAPLGRAWCRAVDEQGFTGLEGLDQRDQVIIGLQGQYDISASLSGTRSYIYLAMRVDHGDFRPTPVNGHSTEMKLLTEYLERAVSLERLAANKQES